jgi:xanthine dehydrogenase accessory factor
VGGAGLEERVKALCREALASGRGGVRTFDLARWKEGGLDSVCGGTATVAIALVAPVPHLLLVGGGHCAQALARVCDTLGYVCTVVDSRAAYAQREAFPNARAVVHDVPARFVDATDDLGQWSHAYLMGHSHHEDGDALLALLARGFGGVVGVIGSRSKMRSFRERARAAGLADAAFDRVRSPIGLDVGAQTPAEIAVAVAAEIVRDVRQGAAPRAQETLA